jgi:hypothetical protein
MKLLPCLAIFITACFSVHKTSAQKMPVWITGRFTDDYGSRYTINDSLFIMDSSIRYHVLEWNEQGQYILAQNDLSNKTDKGLFTRIDYMRFNGMEPFTWGYCFTIFNAPDRQAALQKAAADRANPRKGCNGYPFSRMKREGE